MKLNPKMMEQAMKKMGVQAQEIPAEEVIIRSRDKDIIIRDPQVSLVKMMGQESFQITGAWEERARGVPEADVRMVMEKTGCSAEQARKALEETGGDIAESILRLSGA